MGFANILLYLNVLLWNINLYNDAYVAKITAKRYNIYLREEKEREKKRIHSDWINRILTAILWLLKLINSSLEKVNIKKKRIIEKVLVE
jgi:hypothetical protein